MDHPCVVILRSGPGGPWGASMGKWGVVVLGVLLAGCPDDVEQPSSIAYRTGNTGAMGTPGEMGAMGLMGGEGSDGTAGPPGDPGAPGQMGLQGEQGVMGPPGMDGEAGYTSGSRIKLRFSTTADGARMFRGWHDTALDVDCNPGQASDSKSRCLPETSAFVGVYFANALCTMPLAEQSACNTPPKYAVELRNCGGFGAGSAFRPVTGQYMGAVFAGSASNCSPTTLQSGTTSLFGVGPAVSADTFQEVTDTIE